MYEFEGTLEEYKNVKERLKLHSGSCLKQLIYRLSCLWKRDVVQRMSL